MLSGSKNIYRIDEEGGQCRSVETVLASYVRFDSQHSRNGAWWVVKDCNPSAWKVEARGPQVSQHLKIHSKLEANLCYTKPWIKFKKTLF